MGLEDERKMLTGSGDPKEVRQSDRLEGQELARQNTPGAPLALNSALPLPHQSFQGRENCFP